MPRTLADSSRAKRPRDGASRALRPILAAAALCLAAASSAHAVTIVLQPPRGDGFDTYICGKDSLLNYGGDNKLFVGDEDGFDRALIRFDLSALAPGDVVNSAVLELYLEDAGGSTTGSAPITSHNVQRSWTEGEGDGNLVNGANWVHADTSDKWSSGGGDYDPDPTDTVAVPETKDSWWSWDLTTLAGKWVDDPASNFGVLLKLQTENPGGKYSRQFITNDDSDQGHTPRLVLDVTPAAPAAVDSALAEITPNSVSPGGLGTFTYTVRTFYSAGQNTGVNALTIPLPAGFTSPIVVAVTVGGIPTLFTNSSSAAAIQLGFLSKLTGSRRIAVLFTAIAPASPSVSSVEFRSFVDDTSTPFPPNASTEGSANTNAGDANSWDVLYDVLLPTSIRIVPDAASVSADSTADFDAVSVDLLGNTAPIEPAWSLPGGGGSIGPTGVYSPTTVGPHTISATWNGFSDTAVASVVPGAPAALGVLPDSATVSADTTRLFTATAKDADGNVVAVAKTWSVGGGIGSVDSTGKFTAGTAGAGVVRAVAGALRDSSHVTVTPGRAVSINVTPDSAAVSADSTKLFTAAAHDADGNTVVSPVTWAVRGSIGTVSAGLFTAHTVGQGWVVASTIAGVETSLVGVGIPSPSGPVVPVAPTTLSDSSKVSVTPGILRRLVVTPPNAALTADSGLTFTATGFDADGNSLGTVSPSWSVQGGIGTVSGAGAFDAVTVGSGAVVAKTISTVVPDTAEVIVSHGTVKNVSISPSSATASPGEQIQFDLAGIDGDGNTWTIARSAVAWSTNDPAGSITTSGLYTAGTTLSPPLWRVTGSFAGRSAFADVSVISSGQMARIAIEDTSGVEVGALGVTADDDGLVLRATGYGSGGENLGLVTCTWSVVGSPSVVSVAAGPSVQTSAQFMTAGTARVRAAAAGGLVDTTGAISVAAGRLAALAVAPGPLTVTTDTSLAFVATPLDEDGNAAAQGSISWSVLSGIGTIGAASGVFDPTTTGVGAIRALSSLGVAGDSPAITVAPGALATVTISPASAVVPLGTTRSFSAALADADGNAVAGAVTWSVQGGVGSVDAGGLFTGLSNGQGGVIARSGAHADTAAVTVVTGGSLRILSVRAPRPTVTEGQSGVPITVRVRNETSASLSGFSVSIRPLTAGGAEFPGSVSSVAGPLPGSVAAGAEALLDLSASLSPAIVPGTEIVLDARVSASLPGGAASADSAADTTASWLVQQAPHLVDSENSVWPHRVAAGSSGVEFLLGGWNQGGVDVTLDPDLSTFTLGQGSTAYRSALALDLGLAADSSLTVLSFDASSVPSGLPPGVYPVTLVAAGVDANGKAFAETLVTTGTNDVTVIPPYVTIVPGNVGVGTASPGDTGVPLLALDLDNGYPAPKTVSSLALENVTKGPGTAAQRDAEISRVRLYRDADGDRAVSAGDALLGTAIPSNGSVAFNGLALSLPAEAVTALLAAADVSLTARDGDTLDLRVASAANLTIAGGGSIYGTFPVDPPDRVVVDGSVSAQFPARAIASRVVLAGEPGVLALDVTIPGNGYAADSLLALTLSDLGTASAGGDLSRIRLVIPGGAGKTAADSVIGDMVWSGARWSRTGIDRLVPPAGLRIQALADVRGAARNGATIRLVLPGGEDAATVRSANDGPEDAAAGSGGTLTISVTDRILASAAALPTPDLPQGAPDRPLLSLVVSNAYATTKTLATVDLGSDARAPRPGAEDSILARVTLLEDRNGNGVRDSADVALGTAQFAGGAARFAGVSAPIPSNGSLQLLVTGDVAVGARDGDSLRVRITGGAGFGFAGAPVTVDGTFPLESTPRLPVAGMTAATIALEELPPVTVAPGDRSILVLDATIPANGYQDDRLHSIRVENAGSGVSGDDIEGLVLVRDGGDGIFSPTGGDDAVLGPLSFVGSGWVIDGLDVPVAAPQGARLFVAADFAELAGNTRSFRARLPVGGLTMLSANDGPIDAAVENPYPQTVSTSLLEAIPSVSRVTASVGQELTFRLIVRNRFEQGESPIVGIRPPPLEPFGSGLLTLVSGPTPDSLALDPHATGFFTWRLRADRAGSAGFSGLARGRDGSTGEELSPTPVSWPVVTIVNPPSLVSVFPTDLAPPTVDRNDPLTVVPLSLTLSATGPAPAAGAVVRAIRIGLDDGAGVPVAGGSLLRMVTVAEADAFYGNVTPEGTASEIVVPLSPPIEVHAGDPVTISLGLDLRNDTQVAAFRVSLLAAEWIDAVDENSEVAVPVAATPPFPILSGRMVVTETPTGVTVEPIPLDLAAVNRGQADVRPLRFRFLAYGDPTIASDVRIADVGFSVVDTSGAPAAGCFSEVSLRSGSTIFGTRSGPLPDSGDVRITLSTPIVFPVNTEFSADLVVSLASDTPLPAIRLRIGDVGFLPTARDAATGGPIPVCLDAAGSAPAETPGAALRRPDPQPAPCPFAPFEGPVIAIRSRASSPAVRRVDVAPKAVFPGAANVALFALRLVHGGTADEADLSLEALDLTVTDEAGAPTPAGARLVAISVSTADGGARGGVPIGSSMGPVVPVPLASPIPLAPGDSSEVFLSVTVRGNALAGRLRLALDDEGLHVRDVNEGTRIPVAREPGDFPMLSAPLTVLALPEDPIASFEDLAPVTAAAGERSVPLAAIRIENPPAENAGPVSVSEIRFHCETPGAVVPASGVLLAVRALSGGAVIATASGEDPCRLLFAPPLAIAPGETLALAFEGDLVAEPAASSFRLTLAESDIVADRPGEGIDAPRPRPAAGQSFPFRTGQVGVSAASFEKSISNYPNPFAAGREETRFLLYMEEAGEIDLTIYNPLGDLVAEVARAAPHGQGLITPIRWDGRNGDGETVLSGVYLAEIRVRYLSGRAVATLRKVAVLR